MSYVPGPDSVGFNGNYVIGDSTTNPRLLPNNVKATSSSILSNVIDILANPEGNSWVVALVNNGAVYSGNPSLCVSNCDCGSGGCDVYTWVCIRLLPLHWESVWGGCGCVEVCGCVFLLTACRVIRATGNWAAMPQLGTRATLA